ncbi:MAG: TIGR00297 family protein [Candidatus Syntropharchaeia archaeon]
MIILTIGTFATRNKKKKDGLIKFFYASFSTLILLIFCKFLSFPIYLFGASVCIYMIGDRKESLFLPLVGALFAFLVAIANIHLLGSEPNYDFLLFLVIIGAISGGLLRTIHMEEMIIFGTSMIMWFFLYFSPGIPKVSINNIVFALFLTLVIGILSLKMKAMEVSGVFSGVILGVLTIIFEDIRWFMLLLLFSVLGSLFTKYEFEYKKKIGAAQEKIRDYRNVFSNGLIALAMAVGSGVYHDPFFLVGFIGAVATATGDTLGSEIGQLSKGKPRLITTLKEVPVGTDGGISILGEAASLFGCGIIALSALVMGLGDMRIFISGLIGGLIGCHFDSLLGATLEHRILTNNTVNFFATVCGAGASIVLYLF